MDFEVIQDLNLSDVEAIASLLASAGDPSHGLSVPERKRSPLEAVAQLVDADVYIWTTSTANPDRPGDIITTCMIDGGWRDGRQQAMVFEALTSNELIELQVPLIQAMQNQQVLCVTRSDFVSDEQWQTIGERWRRTGLEHMLLLIYPLSHTGFSGIGLHRSIEKTIYTAREKLIVELIFKRVDWLHRHGTNEPANAKVMGLPPRQRQVLVMLLAGDTKKTIAGKLQLSEHTVGDYVKDIYRHFIVNSRGELQAYFLTANGVS